MGVDEYPYTRISNCFCFDTPTTGKMVKELIMSSDKEKVQARRTAILGRIKTGFVTGGTGTLIGSVGMLIIKLLGVL